MEAGRRAGECRLAMTCAAVAVFVVALALAGTVGWECLDASPVDAPLPLLQPMAEMPSGHPEAPEARQERMDVRAAAVLAQPLFSRTRRPSQEAGAETMPDKPPQLRLTGTLVSQAGRWAIPAPSTGDRAVGPAAIVSALVVEIR